MLFFPELAYRTALSTVPRQFRIDLYMMLEASIQLLHDDRQWARVPASCSIKYSLRYFEFQVLHNRAKLSKYQ